MKNSFFVLVLIYFLLSIHFKTFSQLTNQWEIADSEKILYSTYRSVNGNMSGYDENDIVVFGDVFPYLDPHKNEYKIKIFNDKGQNNKIIYHDSININDLWYSISHPSKNLIVVVGDSTFFQGKFKYGPTTKDWYLYFALLLLSTDGGTTWQRNILDSNKQFVNVSMCDSINGIILQIDKHNYYNQKEFFFDSILITNNGWKTYKTIPVPENVPTDYGWCLSSQNFFLLCYDLDIKRSYLYKTYDTGNTWIKTAYFDENVEVRDIKFINDKKIFVAGGRQVKKYSTLYEPVIYRSNDGGDSWEECNYVYGEKEEDSFSLNSIDFCDSLNGIAVGREGIVLRTNDGGDTWSKEYAPYKYAESFAFDNLLSIFFPKKDFAFASWFRNNTMKFDNKKILSKPRFYRINNHLFQSLNNVIIKWSSVEGAKQYRLKVDSTYSGGNSLNQEFENPLIDTTLTDTSFVMNNLEYDYFYNTWVKAIADTIESDWTYSYDSFGVFKTISKDDELYSPDLLYPAYGSRVETTKLTLLWNKVPTADRYSMIIENDKNIDVINEFVTDTFYTITNVVPSAFYYVSLGSYRADIYSYFESWSYFGTRAVLTVEDELKSEIPKIITYPIPFSTSFNIEFTNNTATNVTLDLFDILGLKIYTKNLGFIESGTHKINIAPNVQLSPGIYLVALRSGDIVQFLKVIKSE